MNILNRRKLLTAAVGGAAGWALWLARHRLTPGSERTREDPDPSGNHANRSGSTDVPSGPAPATPVIVRTTKALGTEVSLTLAERDEALADRAVTAAFAELAEVEAVLSIYRADSQVSRLNHDGVVSSAHRHLLTVLAASQAIARRSNGAFDVTVQPLWDLYAKARREERTPTQAEIAAAQRNVDWKRVEAADGTVRFLRPGMALTFNGIAQGYATDRVSAVLRKHGVQHALIDVGELAAIGDKFAGEPWKAGIQHPRQADAYVSVARMDGRCLATSGDYATTFGGGTDGRRDHHIFDPHTGCSPAELASVSVVASTAMEADGLSTAVFVLGPERGRKLIEETPGADALFVLKSGTMITTPGFPAEA